MFSNLTPIPTAYASLFAGDASRPALISLAFKPLFMEPLVMTRFIITLVGCLFIGYNVFFHYYMAITEIPGFVSTGLSPALHEQRLGPGSGKWWLDARKHVARGSPLSLRAHSELVVVPSVPVKMLKARESSERLARALRKIDPRGQSQPVSASRSSPGPGAASTISHTPGASVVPDHSTAATSIGASAAASTPLATGPLLSQRRTPHIRSSSPHLQRRASTPDASMEHDMFSAHVASVASKPIEETPRLSSRAGHYSESSSSSFPPRNPEVLIAPKPRAGAIHHMPTAQGFQVPTGGAMAMSTSSSWTGNPSSQGRGPSPRSSIDTATSATFLPGAGPTTAGSLLEDIDSDDLFPTAKTCHKCPKIPLFKALAALPPEMRAIERAIRSKNSWPPRSRNRSRQDGSSEEEDQSSPNTQNNHVFDSDQDESEDDIRAWLGEEEAWQMVAPPKPERAHHCSVCRTCILKYVRSSFSQQVLLRGGLTCILTQLANIFFVLQDHHCPWLNQCVGLGNERYFLLFMCWLAFACVIISTTGWPTARTAFRVNEIWPHAYTPRVCVLITWTLSLVIGLGVGVMGAWQLLLVAKGETSVESHDNQHYTMLSLRRGQNFQNVYDLGTVQNLRLFFNVDEPRPEPRLDQAHSLPLASTSALAMGRMMRRTASSQSGGPSHHSHSISTESLPDLHQPKTTWLRILLPIRVKPYSDGWHWAKRRGLGGRHAGIESVEELTDDEEDFS